MDEEAYSAIRRGLVEQIKKSERPKWTTRRSSPAYKQNKPSAFLLCHPMVRPVDRIMNPRPESISFGFPE